MIDVRPSLLAAAAFGLSLAVGTPVAHAGPALSELSDVANYNQDDCAQRAQASLANDGWHGVAANGYTITADRGPLSAVIVCLYQSMTQSVPVIVVAGGDGNSASAEANALKSQLL
jgi:hypothetical protein